MIHLVTSAGFEARSLILSRKAWEPKAPATTDKQPKIAPKLKKIWLMKLTDFNGTKFLFTLQNGKKFLLLR